MHTRRDFLRATLGASAFMSLGPAARHVLAGSSLPRDRDTVLIVVQLTGGNDGLNTVVPYGDDEYGRNRTTLYLPTNDLHKIDSLLAFHPRMGAFLRLYQEGCLSVVQGVGCAGSDRDHDLAMRVWHTAHPEDARLGGAGCQTGWLGRLADCLGNTTQTDLPAVFVGPIARPFALNAATAVVPCIRSAEDLAIRTMPGVRARPNLVALEGDNDLLRSLRDSMRDARAKSERIESAIKSAPGTGEYPPFGLAGHLRTVAQLIRADFGVRVFFVELGGGGIGGFDNHANQLGNHCAMLHQLAESTAAFVEDLRRDKTLDRVLLMTFSEFGRSVRENGRRGTDHGAAGPVFLAGGKVKGGLVGSHPSLTDLDGGAPKPHTDFRRLYATVLDRWLGVDGRSVLGDHFDPLDVLTA
jgi:uncharacterized protein (DUF1501 family)